MPQTKWRLRPKHVQYICLGLDALSLVVLIGIQLLDICCSSVSVRVLVLSSHLVWTQCCWVLIYMIAVLMHRRIRSPSRGPNILYVFLTTAEHRAKVFQRKTGLSHPHRPVSFADRPNAVLLLWFILIVNVRPLSVCPFILFRIAWWPSPLGFLLLLFLFYAVLIVCFPFPSGV